MYIYIYIDFGNTFIFNVSGSHLKTMHTLQVTKNKIRLNIKSIFFSLFNMKACVYRMELADKSKRADVMLPFWGSVISGEAAQSLNKAYCLPLGDNNGGGPAYTHIYIYI